MRWSIPSHQMWVIKWREDVILVSATDWPNSTVDLPAFGFKPTANRTRRRDDGACAFQVFLIVGGAGNVTETRDWNTKKDICLTRFLCRIQTIGYELAAEARPWETCVVTVVSPVGLVKSNILDWESTIMWTQTWFKGYRFLKKQGTFLLG